MHSFASRAKWNAWLAKHHASSSGVWLEISKRDSDIASVTYAEAIEVALCYGWIDGQKAAAAEQRWRQRFTPRTATSRWSKINREKAGARFTHAPVRVRKAARRASRGRPPRS